MNKALWLLIGLQTRGWFRYLVRKSGNAKGAILSLIAVLAVGLWLVAVTRTPRGVASADPENLRRYGPAFFLVYCVLTVLFSGGQRALYFSPAEVNFLFTGPFTRRQLLGYKMTVQALIGVPLAFFFTAIFRIHSDWDIAAFVGLYFGFFFLQVFALCIGVVADLIGGKAYSLSRKILLYAVVAAGGVAIWLASKEAGGFQALVDDIQSSAIWKVVSAPLGTFVEAFLVQRDDWGGLLRWGGLSALVTLGFLGVLMLLDAQFLESAAANSEKMYSQIQKMRRGEAISLHWGGSDKARWGLPAFPWWGGVGPIAWRQATTALRSMSRLALILLLLAPVGITPLFGKGFGDPVAVMGTIMGMLIWLSLLLSTLVPFDFRGDVERIEVLKTLPVSPWLLVIGQILTPVLLLWLLQSLCLMGMVVAGLVTPGMYLLGVGLALSLNFLLFGIDNLLFLWFPSKIFAANPGDFQALGRNVLIIISKMLILVATGAASGGLGFLVHALTGSLMAAVATGWIVLSLFAVTMIPLMALAFQGFDVSRDLPA